MGVATQGREPQLFALTKWDSNELDRVEVAWGVVWPDGKVSLRLGSPTLGKFNETLELSTFSGLSRLLALTGDLKWRNKNAA